MCQFKISRRTAKNIKQSCDKTVRRAGETVVSLSTKTIRAVEFPEIDSAGLQFFTLAREMKFPVTHSVFSHRALHINERLLKYPDLYDETRNRLRDFSASKGWVLKFFSRHALKSVSVHGEGGSASASAVVSEMADLRTKLRGFDVECTLNDGETGLFFQTSAKANLCLRKRNGEISKRDKGDEVRRQYYYVCLHQCSW